MCGVWCVVNLYSFGRVCDIVGKEGRDCALAKLLILLEERAHDL